MCAGLQKRWSQSSLFVWDSGKRSVKIKYPNVKTCCWLRYMWFSSNYNHKKTDKQTPWGVWSTYLLRCDTWSSNSQFVKVCMFCSHLSVTWVQQKIKAFMENSTETRMSSSFDLSSTKKAISWHWSIGAVILFLVILTLSEIWGVWGRVLEWIPEYI